VPWRWRWSSASAHGEGKDDVLVKAGPLLDRVDGRWQDFLLDGLAPDEAEWIRRHERTGRPLGSPSFVERAERALGRRLSPRRPGPKPKRRRRS
jgi:putative transposase